MSYSLQSDDVRGFSTEFFFVVVSTGTHAQRWLEMPTFPFSKVGTVPDQFLVPLSAYRCETAA